MLLHGFSLNQKSLPDSAAWWLWVQHGPGTIASELLEYSYSVL